MDLINDTKKLERIKMLKFNVDQTDERVVYGSFKPLLSYLLYSIIHCSVSQTLEMQLLNTIDLMINWI